MFERGVIRPAMNFELHENVNALDTSNKANEGETNHQMNPNQTVHPITNSKSPQFPRCCDCFGKSGKSTCSRMCPFKKGGKECFLAIHHRKEIVQIAAKKQSWIMNNLKLRNLTNFFQWNQN